ncbi:MAG: PorT family protein [Ekhidna sp.]|nr:PorT family protein [Ekhidna sp.]MBC6424955.1 PorT family protein [Ekhidna sp.]
MKKIFITTIFCFASVLLFAQAKVALGLKVGANFANTDVDNAESITAFHGGAYGLIKIANIGIQPEVLWSKQGGNELSIGNLTKDWDLTYINIPLMLKYYLPLGLNLQAGPQFGILTNAEDDDDDISDRLKSSDLSVVLGAGWDVPFGLQLSARYVLGLSDINDATGEDSIRNRTFQLSIGYNLFKLGK